MEIIKSSRNSIPVLQLKGRFDAHEVEAVNAWLVGTLFKGGGFGILGNIVVGIIGGILGGWVFGLLGISTNGGLLGSIITAVVGGGLLVWLLGMIKK